MLELYALGDVGWYPIELLSMVFNPTKLNYSATDCGFIELVLAF